MNHSYPNNPEYPQHRLDEEFRSDVRFFAFFIGNGSLAFSAPHIDTFDYDDALVQPSSLLATLFTIYLNTYHTLTSPAPADPSSKRAAQYLALQCVPGYQVTPAFAAWELELHALPHAASHAIVAFAELLGRGTLMPQLLEHTQYLPRLVAGGSFLEQIFAIFTNVLVLDERAQIINGQYAARRAAQYIRAYCDPTFRIRPPFTESETELL